MAAPLFRNAAPHQPSLNLALTLSENSRSHPGSWELLSLNSTKIKSQQAGQGMARYTVLSTVPTNTNFDQTKMIPLRFADQTLPRTYEYTLNNVVDNDLDLSVFYKHYRIDRNGASIGINLPTLHWLASSRVDSSQSGPHRHSPIR